ncbi:MviN-like protein [Actinacidiphila alni]|uniref:MviN-like protein n=1 Tax=Actinacidiphila alni TaxID=380248 RepID=A0A1I1ZHM1_9ACTN|nr:lipid II flippase MurJ [Actinacidiphila alni]SFE31145.1 MviN-like protein [Actinacidiphila alni]
MTAGAATAEDEEDAPAGRTVPAALDASAADGAAGAGGAGGSGPGREDQRDREGQEDKGSNGLARAALVTAVLSVAGSVLGLVRDQAIAHLFGAGAASDAFLVSWTVPELAATVLIEDAMALLLVPAFAAAVARRTEAAAGRRGRDPVRVLLGATLPRLTLLLAAATAVLALAAPYVVDVLAPGLTDHRLAVDCTRLTAVTVFTFGLAGYLSAALRAHRRFLPPAAIYIAYNVGIVATLFLLHAHWGARAAAAGVAIGGLLMVLVQLPAFLAELRRTDSPRRDRGEGPRPRARASRPRRATTWPTQPVGNHRTRSPAPGLGVIPDVWSAPGTDDDHHTPTAPVAAADSSPTAWPTQGADTGRRTTSPAFAPGTGGYPADFGPTADVWSVPESDDDHLPPTAPAAPGGRWPVPRARRGAHAYREGRLGLALVAPVIVFTVGRQAQVLIERFFAAPLPSGAISHLNYAQKVAQMPMVLSVMICTVTFPVVSQALARGDRERARRQVQRDLTVVCVMVLLGTAYIIGCAPQIVEVLFQRGAFDASDTAATAAVMRVYALGLLGQSLVGALIRPYFSAARPTWYPAAAMGAGLLLTVAVDAATATAWGAYGIAAGNAAGITVTAALLARGLAAHTIGIGARQLLTGVGRITLAAAVATAAGWALGSLIPDPLAATAVCCIAVPVTFAAAAVAVRVPEVPHLLATAKRRLSHA